MNKNKEYLERRIEEIRSNMIRLRDATEADLKAGVDKEKAELFFKRRNKYKASIEEYIKAYKKWMHTHLNSIDVGQVTDAMILSLGFRDYFTSAEEYRAVRSFCAECFPVDLETCRFYSHHLKIQMDKIYSVLLDTSLSRSEKKESVDYEWFKYDMLRCDALSYYINVGKAYIDISVFGDLKYTDKKGKDCNFVVEADRLLGIAYPYDMRAARLSFDLYRLFGEDNQLEWAFIFTYNYIYRLFVMGIISKINEFFKEPTINGDDPRPIDEVLRDTVKGLNEAIQHFHKLKGERTTRKYKEYVITEYPEVDLMWEMGIGTRESLKTRAGKLNNYTFVLANTIPALYTFKDMISWVLSRDPDRFPADRSEIESLYTQLNSIEQSILCDVYESTYTFDSASKELSIERTSLFEDSIARQVSICNGLGQIVQLVSLKNLDLLFEKKKEVVEQLRNEGVKVHQIEERVAEIVETAVENIRLQIAENHYDSKYIDVINELIADSNVDPEVYDLTVFRSMLGSAEYLYEKYIVSQEEVETFDYSFVAILYYKSLESLINSRFYRPYITGTCADGVPLIDLERRQQDFNDFFPERTCKFIVHSRRLQESCELGKLANILKSDPPAVLKTYLDHNFTFTDEERVSFGEKLSTAANKRNEAAHGSVSLTHEDAREAKRNTYSFDEDINDYRGMILEFLNHCR